ncbi:hypothetical protein DW1_1125 [Proteiniborus sp. DW1]|uniref:LexA family protein n=1 Tax=Proteiniborus sp. DW1 TaxID=1889883 RepID=UPI00092E09FD|nr:winged helix DNA-binding protein [Proteiniborus sp. DW1]SCG82698.1 hypothetical protein DW1_1125 [Proteiniborus sp. DW1]
MDSLKDIITDEEILEVIKKHEGEHMPIRRLTDLLGFYSTSTTHGRIKDLERKGLIKVEIIRETRISVKG